MRRNGLEAGRGRGSRKGGCLRAGGGKGKRKEEVVAEQIYFDFLI